MKKNLTELVFILDRSGSMAGLEKDTIGGFNAMIEKQKAETGEGESFEDVIRTAVSLGGDCDTLTCIAGSMAEAFYGVPEELKVECRKRLPEDLLEVLQQFDAQLLAVKG